MSFTLNWATCNNTHNKHKPSINMIFETTYTKNTKIMNNVKCTICSKIIGARAYSSDENSSVRDEEGHGSHTASTAAGSKVPDASFYGVAKGIARGGVPSARIAAYKVCDSIGCAGEDVLAAFDDAIADGVDLISISLGGEATAVESDIISIGSFHAMEKGILTVHSAGNEGPSVSSVSSVAPWLFSVAASSTDRKIITKVVLANGKTLTVSIFIFRI